MKSSTRSTFLRSTVLVVSAILLGLHCTDCAPNSALSGKGDRGKRYIQRASEGNQNNVKPADIPTQVRQITDHANNRENYKAENNYNTGANNYNNSGNNYNNGVNYSNGGNAPNNGGYFNKPEVVPEESEISVLNETNDGNLDNNAVAMAPENPPQQVSFASIVSSFWNMVVSFIRGALGIERRNPPRIARVLIRAAVSGKEECWMKTACHAGRMMRGLPNSDILFMVAERFTSGDNKKLVRRVRRAAEDNENCSQYECDD